MLPQTFSGLANMETNMQTKKAHQQGQAGDNNSGIVRTALCAAVLATAIPLSALCADTRSDANVRASSLVAQLTLDEKIDQLLNVAPAVPRLSIPAYNWWTESLHGALGPLPTTNF